MTFVLHLNARSASLRKANIHPPVEEIKPSLGVS